MVMGAARRVAHAVQRASDLKVRQPPALRTAPAAGDRPPTVYYLTPDNPRPSGGLRQIYRHVDLLNASGTPAAVLHHERGFRCDWFPHRTRVESAADTVLTPDDLLVVAEWYGPALGRLPAELRKVIFNQNAYRTFDQQPFESTPAGAPLADVANVLALLAVSEDNEEFLRYAFPHLPVGRARVVVDTELFFPGDRDEIPPRRLAYLPRRRRADAEQVLHLLRARGALTGWELVPIDGAPEARVAELLRGCPVFLSFSEREGFGLPPAEAMASGAYVVGFTGLAGREFFDEMFSVPVPEDDVLAFAKRAEQALQTYEQDPAGVRAMGRLAYHHIRDRYSLDGLRDDLAAFYSRFR
ncbi:glycosyltransferase [Catenuloplanes indicus]|uniref:Glycosyltransferase involved in cell wall biosynthesis n=1 Tax=Catenuloplanes indicus TaxID=137267 RepID=A0AAE3VXN1_9ACTN|nr:glycosyltransferase [Catenuloplanes indicus]MDQ0365736.1 glycosyltransferase involved in cell wall biosynthesis [Catenuloplanes indicus]